MTVIGASAGVLFSAYIAAVVKAINKLVEALKIVDNCLNYGCVSSATLIELARVAHQSKHGSHYGFDFWHTVIWFQESHGARTAGRTGSSPALQCSILHKTRR